MISRTLSSLSFFLLFLMPFLYFGFGLIYSFVLSDWVFLERIVFDSSDEALVSTILFCGFLRALSAILEIW